MEYASLVSTNPTSLGKIEKSLNAFSHHGVNSKEDVNLYKKILDWDLSRQNTWLIERAGYSKEIADKMEEEYRKFLFLKIKYPSLRCPMSKKVDDMWHAHVLSTRNYHDFCNKVAGGVFLHHVPTISEDENYALMPDYLDNTILLHAKHFGNPSLDFWPIDAKNGACCGC
ncbi:MAG: hypothetical protein WC011_03000 [Candidatus Paceibacterota bacterium]